MSNFVALIAQIGVILAAARLIGRLFRKIHQPQVMGEMVAGVLLGPSFLGRFAPSLSGLIFPERSLDALNAVSQLGLVLFMFLVGLSLNHEALRDQGEAAVLTSHTSIIFPFFLGGLLALFLYPRLSDNSVTFLGFALFMGAGLSVTAFPVLARILTELNLLRTKLGTLAAACAAVDDVTAWSILAYIVALVRASHRSSPVWMSLLGVVLYCLAMVFGVRPLLRRFQVLHHRQGDLKEDQVAVILLLAFGSALLTERLGIHVLFGAFLLGAVMPKNKDFVSCLAGKFESVTVILLLPLFFAYTGLRMSIGLVHGPEMWLYCLLIVAAAILGKLGGSMIAARISGMAWRDAASLGILMNTRGLMELVILNIGLDIGVISPALFAMMVLMALLTTFMTTPALKWIYLPSLASSNTSEVLPKESPASVAAPVGSTR